jgi:class 3 adenylate cyclase
MPKISFKYKREVAANDDKPGSEFTYNSLTKKNYNSFNSLILGLGNISQNGEYIQSLAAFYDLEGFTSFSNQIDSHLVIPEFLQRYIDWLFRTLAEKFKRRESRGRVTIWGSLPFFTKFLGDGILLLWDTTYGNSHADLTNIISILEEVTTEYQTEFLPIIKTHVSHPPSKLRCGIARGQLISIGNGNDYVGSCINLASRLQKLSKLTIAISRRGFDMSLIPPDAMNPKEFVLKKVELRGIGDEELVYIRQREFRQLPPSERKLFRAP